MNPAAHLHAHAGLPAGRPAPAPTDFRADVAALAKAMDTAPLRGTHAMFASPWGLLLTTERDEWPDGAEEWLRDRFNGIVRSKDYYEGNQ